MTPDAPLRRSLLAMLLVSFCSIALDVRAGAPPMSVADYDLSVGLGDVNGNGAALTKVGAVDSTPVTVQVYGVDREALSVPVGAGLRLETDALLPLDAYSIAIWVRQESVTGYAKLVDTRNLTTDLGLYSVSTDLRYFSAGVATTGSFTAGAFHQVVVTRTSQGAYSGYINGAPQFSFIDSADDQATAISADRVLHFLRDDNQTANSEEGDFVLLRVQLFDSALSPADVRAIDPSFVFGSGFEAVP